MSLRLGDDFARVLAAGRAGQEWAVTSIYRAIQPGLLRYLRARERREAEDIASQVWLEVARLLPGFSGEEDELRALVFTIGRRRLANVRRGRTRRPETVDQERLDGVVAPDDPAATVEARAASRDAIAAGCPSLAARPGRRRAPSNRRRPERRGGCRPSWARAWRRCG